MTVQSALSVLGSMRVFVLVPRQADAMAHCCQCETYLPRICRYCFANISTGRYWDPKESSPCELELTILGIVELPRFLVQLICSLYTLNVATHGMSTRKSCCFGSCSSSMWMSKQDLALTLKQKEKSSALRELSSCSIVFLTVRCLHKFLGVRMCVEHFQ